MKRICVCFILFTALILLTTCGIPIIYVPTSSDISINADYDKGEFTISISSVTAAELSDSSPTLFFFYTIADESDVQRTGYNSVISSFNSSYATETDGTEISTVFKSEQPFIKATSNNVRYGLYQFSNAVYYDISGETSIKLKIEMDTNTYKLNLYDITEGEEILEIANITRYNEKSFSSSDLNSDHTEIASSDTSGTQYYLNVYAVVSCKFDYYTNTYNKTISRTSPVYKYLLTF